MGDSNIFLNLIARCRLEYVAQRVCSLVILRCNVDCKYNDISDICFGTSFIKQIKILTHAEITKDTV